MFSQGQIWVDVETGAPFEVVGVDEANGVVVVQSDGAPEEQNLSLARLAFQAEAGEIRLESDLSPTDEGEPNEQEAIREIMNQIIAEEAKPAALSHVRLKRQYAGELAHRILYTLPHDSAIDAEYLANELREEMSADADSLPLSAAYRQLIRELDDVTDSFVALS